MTRKRAARNRAPLFALAGIALSSASWAQQSPPAIPFGSSEPPAPYSPSAAAADQGGSPQLGGITLKLADTLITVHPSINVEVRHDDNIFLSPNDRVADRILVLTPAVRLDTRHANNRFSLRLSTTIGQYQRSRADNYTNYNVNGTAELELSTRLRANLSADYLDGEDPRGSTNNPFSTTPDRYHQIQGRGMLSYGAQGARGRIDFELGQVRRNYYNDRAITAAEDRVTSDYGATFHWRVAPKTTLLFQGKHTTIDYTLSTSTLGSRENALLAGAEWDATAITKLAFRAGRVKKDFDDPAHATSTTTSWTGELNWRPLSYSRVDLTFNRTPAETTGGVGDYIDRTNTSARWTHDWTSRFTTETSVAHLTDAYQGVARTDNTERYGLKATYKMRRWLRFGGDFTHGMRNSDDSNFDYRQNVLMLFFNASL